MMIFAYLRIKFSSLKMNNDRLASRPCSFSAAMRLWATAAATLASWAAPTVLRWPRAPVPAGSALLKTRAPSAPGRSMAARSPSSAALASISEFIAGRCSLRTYRRSSTTTWLALSVCWTRSTCGAVVLYLQQFVVDTTATRRWLQFVQSHITRRSPVAQQTECS